MLLSFPVHMRKPRIPQLRAGLLNREGKRAQIGGRATVPSSRVRWYCLRGTCVSLPRVDLGELLSNRDPTALLGSGLNQRVQYFDRMDSWHCKERSQLDVTQAGFRLPE